MAGPAPRHCRRTPVLGIALGQATVRNRCRLCWAVGSVESSAVVGTALVASGLLWADRIAREGGGTVSGGLRKGALVEEAGEAVAVLLVAVACWIWPAARWRLHRVIDLPAPPAGTDSSGWVTAGRIRSPPRPHWTCSRCLRRTAGGAGDPGRGVECRRRPWRGR